MKILLIIALALVTSVTFAKTLEQYDASNAYIVAWPTVVFSNISVPVKNVCVDGENLKTINPAKYCSKSAVEEVCTKSSPKSSEECRAVNSGETPVQKPGTRLVWGCVAYASKSFETSRTYEASVCTKWEKVETGSHNNTSWICVETGSVSKEYALSYDVSVTAIGNGHSGREEVANINFAIPQCK